MAGESCSFPTGQKIFSALLLSVSLGSVIVDAKILSVFLWSQKSFMFSSPRCKEQLGKPPSNFLYGFLQYLHINEMLAIIRSLFSLFISVWRKKSQKKSQNAETRIRSVCKVVQQQIGPKILWIRCSATLAALSSKLNVLNSKSQFHNINWKTQWLEQISSNHWSCTGGV